MAERAELIRLAVFGQPVSQSLSPRIHTLFAAQFGLEIDYRAVETTAESFGPGVGELARAGGRGCNITVPFKGDAWRLATLCSERATRAEAANTLVFTAKDWFADNTDGGGLVGDLQDNLGLQLAGARICLLGAGGAAGGVLAALLQAGPDALVIANRTEARAAELAARHADLGPVESGTLSAVGELEPFDLLINATSLGHQGKAPDIEASRIKSGGLCYDMNYGQAAEPLRARCAELQIDYSDGLGMLVGQAALSFRLWTGKSPDQAAVLAALRRPPGE